MPVRNASTFAQPHELKSLPASRIRQLRGRYFCKYLVVPKFIDRPCANGERNFRLNNLNSSQSSIPADRTLLPGHKHSIQFCMKAIWALYESTRLRKQRLRSIYDGGRRICCHRSDLVRLLVDYDPAPWRIFRKRNAKSLLWPFNNFHEATLKTLYLKRQ
jgi:hypothetical protein